MQWSTLPLPRTAQSASTCCAYGTTKLSLYHENKDAANAGPEAGEAAPLASLGM